jgi:metallo-beta-lactamase family protein
MARLIARGSWVVVILLALGHDGADVQVVAHGPISSPPSRVVAAVYGAAGEVAGSMSVLDTGNARWMIDCGSSAPEREGEKEDRPGPDAKQPAALPVDAASVAAVFLTHAHSDHVGRLPLLVEAGFRGPIYLTDATAELLPLMLRMQVRYDEARPRNWAWSKQAYERARSGERPVTVHWHADCPYRGAISRENLDLARLSLGELTARFARQDPAVDASLCRRCGEAEVASIVALCRRVGYDKPMEVAQDVSVTMLYAGHIPGSASVFFEVRVGEKKRRVLFSGDVGNDLSPLFAGPRPAPDVDAVFVETTYGPTLRDPSVNQERAQFRRAVGGAIDRGHVAWIPLFALDRTQKILHELRLAQQEGTLSERVPIYCTSSTALEITAIYRQHRQDGWFREAVAGDPSAWSPLGLRKSAGLPKNLPRPSVLLTTSGMLEHGVSRTLVSRLVPDKSAVIFLVGYQDPASPGGMLMKAAGLLREGTRDQASLTRAAAGLPSDNAKKPRAAAILELDGRQVPVHAAVRYFRCFSAHGDARDMDAWLSKIHRTATVILVHGGPWELTTRAEQLIKQGRRDVRIAKPGEPIELTRGN